MQDVVSHSFHTAQSLFTQWDLPYHTTKW